MGHRVGLSAQIQQGVRDSTRNINKSQIFQLRGGLAQSGRHLPGYREQNIRVLAANLMEALIGNFRYFALVPGDHQWTVLPGINSVTR